MRTQTRQRFGYFIAGVLIFLGGLPAPGSASDRDAPGEVVTEFEAGPGVWGAARRAAAV